MAQLMAVRIGIVDQLIPVEERRRSDRVHVVDLCQFSGQAFLRGVDRRLQRRVCPRRWTGGTETENERHFRTRHERPKSATEVVQMSLEMSDVPRLVVARHREALAASGRDRDEPGPGERWLLIDDAPVTPGGQEMLDVTDLPTR